MKDDANISPPSEMDQNSTPTEDSAPFASMREIAARRRAKRLTAWQGISETAASLADFYSSLEAGLSPTSLPSSHQLGVDKRINELEAELYAKNVALATTQMASEARLRDLETDLRQLRRQVQLQRLLRCVTPRAHPFIFGNQDFTNRFSPGSRIEAYVMSLDIRRSTELMLKARTPSEFAAFITNICQRLEEILKENYGFVDKFTGDGVLAFFPVQFAGKDAGRRALHAASQAHRAFEAVYRAHRHNFSVILDEVGLGVGIDFGIVELVEISGALTVVGQPVVYACRLGGAPAGSTLLNVAAYQQLCQQSPPIADFEEYVLSVKSEGAIVAFRSRSRESAVLTFADPDWAGSVASTEQATPTVEPGLSDHVAAKAT